MHRTYFVPRLIGLWSLLFVLSLHVGLPAASAQPPKGITEAPVVVMAVGTTQIYQASSKEKLKKAENPNPKVVLISPVARDPSAVLIEAISPGRTRIVLTDEKGRVEMFDIVVVSDRVKDLRDLIQRSIPSAAVTVTANDNNNLVVLSGNVLTATDAKVIRAAAKNLFGENVIDNIVIGGVQQVQLQVVVAVVNRSRARNMSFSWTANGNNGFIGSLFGGPFTFTNNLATGVINSIGPATGSGITNVGTFNVPFGVMGNSNNFLSFLQILTTEGVTKILAEPRLTTLSGRPANIVSGGSTPILTSAGVGATSVSYQNFGTVVSCLPTVLGNGKILLEVKPEVSSINAANGINITGVTPTSIPGFDVRSAQVTVQVEDGQTLAIGGLIQNKVNTTISKIPVLGDLPFLSVFFTQKAILEDEEEMVILVTPRLVDPIDCTKFPKYLPGRETRNPDDFEFFLEGILEAPRGPRNLVLHPALYQAAYKGAPNVGQIPCADGNCNGRPGGCATGNCSPSMPGGVMNQPTIPATNGYNFAAPTTVPLPSVPATPAANSNKIVIESEVPTFTTVREIPPSLGPASATTPVLPVIPPTIPATPVRELQNRPVLPPLSSPPYTPN